MSREILWYNILSIQVSSTSLTESEPQTPNEEAKVETAEPTSVPTSESVGETSPASQVASKESLKQETSAETGLPKTSRRRSRRSMSKISLKSLGDSTTTPKVCKAI